MRLSKIIWMVLVLILLMSLSWTADGQTNKPVEYYKIEVLVPGRVVLLEIKSLEDRSSVEVLSEGIKEIGKEYNIKSGLPVVEPAGFGTWTRAVILFVEPKKY